MEKEIGEKKVRKTKATDDADVSEKLSEVNEVNGSSGSKRARKTKEVQVSDDKQHVEAKAKPQTSLDVKPSATPQTSLHARPSMTPQTGAKSGAAALSQSDSVTDSASTPQSTQDFSKFAKGPQSYGQASSAKPKSRGQFDQLGSAPGLGAGQFGQASEYSSKGRGQFGQASDELAAGRGQFGQTGPAKTKRGQFDQAAPSEMHSQSLSQRQEETIKRAYQQKEAEQRFSQRFRILAASIAAVIVLGLILGIAFALRGSGDKVILSIDLDHANAQTTYRVGEALNVDGLKIFVKYTDGTKETLNVKPEWVTAGNLLDKTTQTFRAATSGYTSLTVTYKGIPKSFNITVSREVVTGNTVSKIEDIDIKKEYDVDEKLAEQGATLYYKLVNDAPTAQRRSITINQKDSSKNNLDRFGAGLNWDWSPRDFSKAANAGTFVDITVKHKDGAKLVFQVFVRGLSDTTGKIEVVSEPLFKNYSVGSDLIRIGLKVEAVKKDGTTREVLQPEQYSISPTTLLEANENFPIVDGIGERRVPVEVTHYSESGVPLTAVFYVNVTTDLKPNYNPNTNSMFPIGERGLEVNSAPSRGVYSVWDSLEFVKDTDPTSKTYNEMVVPGFTLTARYQNNTYETVKVTRAMILSNGLDHAARFTRIGTTTLTIRYKGLTATQTIRVLDGVRNIRILGTTQTFYQQGDYLGRIAIEATYNGINQLTGKNNSETFYFNNLEQLRESGFDIRCGLSGGYDTKTDQFSTNAGGERSVQLFIQYNNAWTEIAVSVVNQITYSGIVVAFDGTQYKVGDTLDLSTIIIQATRDSAGAPYHDGQSMDTIFADGSRQVRIESTSTLGGSVDGKLYSKFTPGVGIEQKLTFTESGVISFKVTYRDVYIGTLQITVAE